MWPTRRSAAGFFDEDLSRVTRALLDTAVDVKAFDRETRGTWDAPTSPAYGAPLLEKTTKPFMAKDTISKTTLPRGALPMPDDRDEWTAVDLLYRYLYLALDVKRSGTCAAPEALKELRALNTEACARFAFSPDKFVADLAPPNALGDAPLATLQHAYNQGPDGALIDRLRANQGIAYLAAEGARGSRMVDGSASALDTLWRVLWLCDNHTSTRSHLNTICDVDRWARKRHGFSPMAFVAASLALSNETTYRSLYIQGADAAMVRRIKAAHRGITEFSYVLAEDPGSRLLVPRSVPAHASTPLHDPGGDIKNLGLRADAPFSLDFRTLTPMQLADLAEVLRPYLTPAPVEPPQLPATTPQGASDMPNLTPRLRTVSNTLKNDLHDGTAALGGRQLAKAARAIAIEALVKQFGVDRRRARKGLSSPLGLAIVKAVTGGLLSLLPMAKYAPVVDGDGATAFAPTNLLAATADAMRVEALVDIADFGIDALIAKFLGGDSTLLSTVQMLAAQPAPGLAAATGTPAVATPTASPVAVPAKAV